MSTILVGDGLCACGCGMATRQVNVEHSPTALAGLPRRYLHGHNMRGRVRSVRPLAERFAAKVDRSAGPGACWPWMGARSAAGYGQIKVDGLRVGTHRVALQLALGRPLLPGMDACHTCDNPPCCNTTLGHLYEGTRSDNNRDSWARSRRRAA